MITLCTSILCLTIVMEKREGSGQRHVVLKRRGMLDCVRGLADSFLEEGAKAAGLADGYFSEALTAMGWKRALCVNVTNGATLCGDSDTSNKLPIENV